MDEGPQNNMAPTLSELQKMMQAWVLRGELDPRLEESIDPIGLTAQERLQIHSNNYSLSLKQALADTFPLVQVFLGEAFFNGLAGEFIKKHPPKEPMLSEWGGDFADFTQNFEAAKGVAYVADVAALEWAIHVSASARDEALYEPASGKPAKMANSAQLVKSRWPLMMLWMAGSGQIPPEAIDMDAAPQNILVVRKESAVKLHIVSDADCANYLKLLGSPSELTALLKAGQSPLNGEERHLFVAA